MRLGQFWWRTIAMSIQHDPPRFVEFMMLLLAFFLLVIWVITDKWPYITLSLSYIIGASTSILIREAIVSLSRRQPTQAMLLTLFILSFCGVMTYYVSFEAALINH